MLKFSHIALLATLALSCSNLPPEVPIPENGKTEDGHDVVVYPDKYLDNILDRIDTATSGGSSNMLIFKGMKPKDIPSVGDIIASPPTKNAPYGFLYKTLAVSTKDGITAVAARNATLEEAIEEVDFESETEFEFDENGNPLRMLQKSSLPSVGLVKEIPLGDDKKLTADVSYTTTFVFNITIKKWKIQSTKMGIKQNGKTSLKGSIKEKIEKTIKKEIGKVNIPNVTFWVSIIPVVVSNDLSFYLKIAGSAEAELAATYTINTNGEYGFEYRNGSFAKIATSSFEPSFDYEQSVSGEISIGAMANLATKLYGAAGLALDAGPSLKLSVEGKPVGVYVFENGFQNSEKNGVYLNLGLDYAAKITLGMLGFNLSSHTFAEGWTTLRSIYKTSFLPSFDAPQLTISDLGVTVKSGIKRDKLNYPVKTFGICIESTRDGCKNGSGERKPLGEDVKSGEYRAINATFSNIGYKDYNIMPYFENGRGGTYYDKAVSVVQGVVQSSSSNSGSSSSVAKSSSSASVASSGKGNDIANYRTVTIGDQVWMAENLDYDVEGSKCYGEGGKFWNSETEKYDITLSNEEIQANCNKYGRLYDWVTAMALPDSCYSNYCSRQKDAKHQGICPSGWHIPSSTDWNVLMKFINPSCSDNINNSCAEAGTKLKATSGWYWSMYEEDNINGTDDYGFAALPGGVGDSDGGFYYVGFRGYWWIADIEIFPSSAYCRTISEGWNVAYIGYYKSELSSVRCVQD